MGVAHHEGGIFHGGWHISGGGTFSRGDISLGGLTFVLTWLMGVASMGEGENKGLVARETTGAPILLGSEVNIPQSSVQQHLSIPAPRSTF